MRRLLIPIVLLLLLTPSPLAAQVVNASRINLNGTWVSVGSASPESSVTGSPGDVYIRTNGSMYIKATGSNTNTGWSLMAAGISSGTVTSVGLSLPGTFSVSGSPVTTSGTLTASFASQSAKTFFSGPSSGASATPTWRQPQLTDLGQGGASVNQVVAWDGTQWAAADNSGTGAPTGAQYLTLATDATLTNERVLTAGTGIAVTDAGAGSTLTVAADGANITSLNASNLASGTVAAARMPALTGDVTTSAGAVATTISNDAVTNAKSANMAQSTIKGRAVSAGTGDPTDLTATQATAILDVVVGDSGSGGTKGLVPAPGSGDAAAGKFLKADGTFAVPPGTGGGGTVTNTGTLTSGKLIQGNGSADVTVSSLTATVVKSASGTLSAATGGTDYADNAFKTMAVSGQSDVVADSAADTMTLVAGTNITLTTNASTDTVTIAASGAAASPGLVLIEQHAASASSTLDFTSCISSTYDEYQFEIVNYVPTTTDTNLYMRLSTDGGSTYISTSTYGMDQFIWRAGGTAVGGATETAFILNWYPSADFIRTGNTTYTGSFTLYNPLSSTAYKNLLGTSRNLDVGNLIVSTNIGGSFFSTTAANAVRFLSSSGTMASGAFRCYGVAK